MKQKMLAELLFDTPAARDRAIPELEKCGYAVELLDWVDPLGTPVVWVNVRGLFEGSDSEFLDEMNSLANKFGGEAIEAGYEQPSLFPSQDGDDNVPVNLRD